MVAPFRNLSNKMGGVSIISGTLTSASGAFPTFVTLFIILCYYYKYVFIICQLSLIDHFLVHVVIFQV